MQADARRLLGALCRAQHKAHARRKFYEALSSAPEAKEILDKIVALYRVEHDSAENSILGTEAQDILRGERSRPIVDDIEAWIDAHNGNTPP